jgi:hypothetical protein
MYVRGKQRPDNASPVVGPLACPWYVSRETGYRICSDCYCGREDKPLPPNGVIYLDAAIAQQASAAGKPAMNAGSNPASRAIRNAAIESSSASYVKLTCGHFGSREVDVFYSSWRPSRDKHWCETCSKWLTKKKETRAEYPLEPLF